MTAQLKAQNGAELALISDSLHDAWFNAEKIRFDPSSGRQDELLLEGNCELTPSTTSVTYGTIKCAVS